ncbi:MAG: GNAT family N-acetyltransferase [Clostridiales bacterium]|nr:GNAT family N-acetyltransferase [Clostridiales bacterium]
MARVRPYECKDQPAVQGVCIATGPANANKPEVRARLLACFCDYYVEKEPENCFVLADDDANAVGYILCAENFGRYYTAFCKEYVGRARQGGLVNGISAWFTTLPQHFYAKKYPAHLHIDILPAYQRQGWGTVLMDTLTNHLRAKKIPAVMLVVGAGNKKGISFYKKYGFVQVKNIFGFVAMALKL